MSEHARIDPERLAALIDGRLSEAEVGALRAELAHADDDTLAAFADAIALTESPARSDATGTPADRSIVSIHSARRWRYLIVGALAAAALITVVLARPRTDGSVNNAAFAPQQLASALATSGGTDGTRPWGVTRGGSAVSDGARAARIGALLTDFELRSSPDSTTRAIARELADLLADVPGGSSVALEFRAIADGNTPDATARRSAAGHAMLLADGAILRAAAWLEAARIASAGGDAAFFARFPGERALGEVNPPEDTSAPERDAMSRLRTAVRPSAGAFAGLRADAETLLRYLTR